MDKTTIYYLRMALFVVAILSAFGMTFSGTLTLLLKDSFLLWTAYLFSAILGVAFVAHHQTDPNAYKADDHSYMNEE